MLWATRFEVREYEDGAAVEREVFVVAEAEDAGEAARDTGLIHEEFHPATEAEVVEWESVIEDPLDEADLEVLDKAAEIAQRQVGGRRDRLDRRGTKGGPLDRQALWQAHKLARARARLSEPQ